MLSWDCYRFVTSVTITPFKSLCRFSPRVTRLLCRVGSHLVWPVYSLRRFSPRVTRLLFRAGPHLVWPVYSLCRFSPRVTRLLFRAGSHLVISFTFSVSASISREPISLSDQFIVITLGAHFSIFSCLKDRFFYTHTRSCPFGTVYKPHNHEHLDTVHS